MASLATYLETHPKLREAMQMEVGDAGPGNTSGAWLNYTLWSDQLKNRLEEFNACYENGSLLPLPPPANLIKPSSGFPRAYINADVARDVYLAQVAYALWCDMYDQFPWKLESYSQIELQRLLASVSVWRARGTGDNVRYLLDHHNSIATTHSFLHDPRQIRAFMVREYEQGRRLVGQTQAETGYKLTEWFHDYLHHGPGNTFDWDAFYIANPMLSDRLRRHQVPWFPNPIYITTGCWNASSMFVDIMRAVNIPVRLVNMNIAGSIHAGLAFMWSSGGNNRRYIIHTDDMYVQSFYLNDPAPAPKETERGVALWNEAWLGHEAFQSRFTLNDPINPNLVEFASATLEQYRHHRELSNFLVSSASAVRSIRNNTEQAFVSFQMTQNNFTQAEAQMSWDAVESSVLSYGDGSMALGFERLLDGSTSRHALWCSRTQKCGLAPPNFDLDQIDGVLIFEDATSATSTAP